MIYYSSIIQYHNVFNHSLLSLIIHALPSTVSVALLLYTGLSVNNGLTALQPYDPASLDLTEIINSELDTLPMSCSSSCDCTEYLSDDDTGNSMPSFSQAISASGKLLS